MEYNLQQDLDTSEYIINNETAKLKIIILYALHKIIINNKYSLVTEDIEDILSKELSGKDFIRQLRKVLKDNYQLYNLFFVCCEIDSLFKSLSPLDFKNINAIAVKFIKNKYDINDWLTILLEDRFKSEVDELIYLFKDHKYNNILTSGVVNAKLATDSNRIINLEFDILRYRYNLIHSIVNNYDITNICLGKGDALNSSLDFVYLSMGKSYSIYKLGTELDNSNYTPKYSAKWLVNRFSSSHFFNSDIIYYIENLSIDGTLYISTYYDSFLGDNLIEFRKYLIENHYLAALITIVTGRQERILLKITKRTNKFVRCISSNFYTKGRFKAKINDSGVIDSIAAVINNSEPLVASESSGDICYDIFAKSAFSFNTDALLKINNNTALDGNDRQEYPLEEICSLVIRGPHVFHNKVSNFNIEEPYYLFSQLAIGDDDIIIDNLLHITKEQFVEHSRFRIKKYDILMLSRATDFRFIQIQQDINLIVNSNAILIRADDTKVNPQYLYLLLKSNKNLAILNSFLTSSRVKSLSLSRVRTMKLELIELDEQERLVSSYNQIQSKHKEYLEKYQNSINKIINSL